MVGRQTHSCQQASSPFFFSLNYLTCFLGPTYFLILWQSQRGAVSFCLPANVETSWQLLHSKRLAKFNCIFYVLFVIHCTSHASFTPKIQLPLTLMKYILGFNIFGRHAVLAWFAKICSQNFHITDPQNENFSLHVNGDQHYYSVNRPLAFLLACVTPVIQPKISVP